MKPLALALVGLVVLLAGCGKATTPSGPGKFYWVQGLKGHPVHQLTQIAFAEGCAKAGYTCEIIGTDNTDLNATIALAEQVIARGDAKGLAIWTGTPAWNPLIARASRAKIPVILPHFPSEEGSVPGASGIISCDPAAYGRTAAQAIGEAINGTGAVAVTQGSFNSTENLVTESFVAEMKARHPQVKVLPPEEEGFDPAKSIAKAAAIVQAHPEVVAALSTTGGGPTTWAGAQKETGRKLVIIGMDYTRVNLDLVSSGQIHAIIAQPLWHESFGTAELLATLARGGTVPWWTKLEAPLVTKDMVAPYAAILDKVEAAIKKR